MTQADKGTGGGMTWPAAFFWVMVAVVAATCYLGRIEALPWQ